MHDEHVRTRPVVIVAFPGLQSLDAIGPFEVFASATSVIAGGNRATEHPAYDVRLVAADGLTIASESGVRFATDPLPSPLEMRRSPIDTLLIPGGDGVHDARRDDAFVEWIRLAASHSRRVATVCTGTFIAAQAGLLDGRRVTTHWARARRLAAEFPTIDVDPDPIYIRDGDCWTSAGVTAGIDLALAMVEADHGAEAAQTVARWLVMFLHRPGGQTQFATPVWTPRADHDVVRAAQAAIDADPSTDHRIPVLAGAANMSARHFTRVFTEEVGESPGRYVERVRLETARRLLETTTDTLDVVATNAGLGTAETLRRLFHRRLGITPDTYRRRFRVA